MDIAQRLRWLIAAEVTSHRKYKALEDMSGVSAEAWRAFDNGRQKASGEMIEAAARAWPDYAYWLACGDTEPEYGNVAPSNAELGCLMNGAPQEWATKERLLKQQFLRDQSLDQIVDASNKGGLSDAMLSSKDGPAVMAGYLLFEKIARQLGDTPRPEAGILESDPELIEVRAQRAKAASNALNLVSVARKNFADARKFLDFISRWKTKLKMIAGVQNNGN